MRALVQRVSRASVTVDDVVVGQIGRGILVFLGVHQNDSVADADYLAKKICYLRIFPDFDGKMNLSLRDILGELLVVSQFTLCGDTTRGNRPSYSQAAAPEIALRLYDYFLQKCREQAINVQAGTFQADMKVSLENDGPVTLMLSSET